MDNNELARCLGRIEGHQKATSKSLEGINSHLEKLNDRTGSLERFRARIKGATALGVVFVGVGGTVLTAWIKNLAR